jgi:hypothetical protein
MGKEKCKSGAWGRKELRELYASYGEDNIYNSGMFKPLTRNLTTGKQLQRGHHCNLCKGKMSLSCYDNFHYGYCPTWVTRKGKRERCGERFCFRSNGCGKHPRVQGFNETLFRAANGGEVDMSEFDDPDPQNFHEESDDNDDNWENEMEEMQIMTEKHLAVHGYVPENLYTDYFVERAKLQTEKHKAQKQSENDTLTLAPDKNDGACNTSVIGNGKTGAGKKAKTKVVTWAPGTRQNSSRVRLNGNTYGGPAGAPDDTDQPGRRKSYAPKGAKQKAPMEAARGSMEAQEVKETKTDRAKKLVGKVFGRANGA